MGDEIAYLMPTKCKIFLGKGRCPLTTPARGPASWTPVNTSIAHRLSFPQFKIEWRPCMWISVRKWGRAGGPRPNFHFWWQSGEMNHSGESKIGGSMESLVEMIQIENSLRNYVNFTLGNRFSWAFKTLKPISFRGLRPLDPCAKIEYPMKIVQINNSVQNYMWILPPILPSKMGFLGL